MVQSERMEKESTPAWPIRVLRTAGLAAGTVVALSFILIMFFEDSFIYMPTKGDVGPSPDEDVTLTTSDGVKIHGWYTSRIEAQVTLLWFHGNAGNIEHRRGLLRDLRNLPANVLIIDYRGYGKSEGAPSEEGLYLDARAAYDWLLTKTTPDRIILFGKSLGGAPACELAAQVKVGGLICESAFTSAGDMASRIMPFFPARYFLRHRFDNLEKVGRIACPKLFIHSRQDEMIPFEMAERLFAAAADPKEQAWFDRGGHNDMDHINGKEYLARMKRFIDGVASAAAPR